MLSFKALGHEIPPSFPEVLTVEKVQPVIVEGIAAILFQTVDVTDPIEVGGETTDEIRVLNQGSKAATNASTTSCIDTSSPSARSDVTPWSRMPHATMWSNQPMSVSTFRATPCKVRPRSIRTPIAATSKTATCVYCAR